MIMSIIFMPEVAFYCHITGKLHSQVSINVKAEFKNKMIVLTFKGKKEAFFTFSDF